MAIPGDIPADTTKARAAMSGFMGFPIVSGGAWSAENCKKIGVHTSLKPTPP